MRRAEVRPAGNVHRRVHIGAVRLYKHVKRISDTEFASCHDPSFIYRLGEVAETKANPNPTVSCSTGLHASTLSYWESEIGVDACIAVDVRVEDIICVLDGKVRCKRLMVVGVVENRFSLDTEANREMVR